MRKDAWTREQERAVYVMFNDGATDKDIGKAIGKTAKAVKVRRSLIGAVKWHRGSSEEVKPPIESFVVNTPVTEIENPQLELTDKDKLVDDVVESIQPYLTIMNSSATNINSALVSYKQEMVSMLGNNRGDFITTKENIEEIKKLIDERMKPGKYDWAYTAMLVGIGLVVAAESLWNILN